MQPSLFRCAVSVALALLAWAGQCGRAPAAEPIDVGSRLELFVDRHLIDRLDGGALKLHAPV